MPGVELKPRALISGSAYVGYRRFTPTTTGTLPTFNGLVSQLTSPTPCSATPCSASATAAT